MNTQLEHHEGPWPHRWAVALVCVTFPLIWVGGMVTTYKAGMSVPDYPTTFGYNMFLYPWTTWIYGPWNLFIEHGHRLHGVLSGVMAIGLVAATWWCQRDWMVRWLAVLALAAVIFQGSLGGLRVIKDEVLLARIHACVGPAFFAYAVAVAAITSRRWRQHIQTTSQSANYATVERYAVLTTLLAYCQIVLGSQLRHLPAGSQPGDFRVALFFHLAVAAALLVHIVLLSVAVFRAHRDEGPLVRPAAWLLILVALQVGLGAATWVTRYGWPSWLGDYEWAAGYVVAADSGPQASIATAHVAMGSMLLANCVLIAVRSARFAWQSSHTAPLGESWRLEAAR